MVQLRLEDCIENHTTFDEAVEQAKNKEVLRDCRLNSVNCSKYSSLYFEKEVDPASVDTIIQHTFVSCGRKLKITPGRREDRRKKWYIENCRC